MLAAYRVAPEAGGYVLSDRFQPALLLLFGDDLPIHSAREAILRLQIDWREKLEAPPFVFTPSSLARHTRLFPLFHAHIAAHAQHLHGQILPLQSSDKVHAVERLTFLIGESIAASAALAPARSDPATYHKLQRLAQLLSGEESDPEASPAELFARVQVYLRHIFDSLPALAQHRTPLVKSTTESNLLAFYEDQQRLLAIIPPLSANLIQRIDWSALVQPMAAHLTTLNVATADQLFLAIQALRPLDYVLGNFRLLWGASLLKGLAVSARAVFRQAARRPAALLCDGVLGEYLLAPNAKALHQVIHDYQNRLLNLRLSHELLCRQFDVPLSEPPTPLPRRDEPLSVRIDAIVAHLNWWADHYLQLMDSRPASEKLSPP